MDKGRLEAFSDGVFAIAITLLVLEIHVPFARPGGLWGNIERSWPHFAAYLVSFLIIGIIWVNHHGVFRYVAHVDRAMTYLNLLLLLFVVLIPFATNLLATYLREGGANSHVAAAVYSVVGLGMALSFQSLWRWIIHDDRLHHVQVDERAMRRATKRFSLGLLVYPVTIALVRERAAHPRRPLRGGPVLHVRPARLQDEDVGGVPEP